MKTILVPVDFSPISKRVIAEAVALSRAHKAKLVIIHVIQPPIVTDSDAGTQMSAEYAALNAQSAAVELAAIQKRLRGQGLTVETKHKVDFPGKYIPDLARTLPADYIVLGSHGHGAFYDLIIGSTTSRVLKRAHCPVMVVPPKRRSSRR